MVRAPARRPPVGGPALADALRHLRRVSNSLNRRLLAARRRGDVLREDFFATALIRLNTATDDLRELHAYLKAEQP
ncbi:MAG: hypothetical protein H6Q33_179 [Deltaproteobacteria bacterium]|nr:hypothetical protein [Deltaproteobacteria bacterium]